MSAEGSRVVVVVGPEVVLPVAFVVVDAALPDVGPDVGVSNSEVTLSDSDEKKESEVVSGDVKLNSSDVFVELSVLKAPLTELSVERVSLTPPVAIVTRVTLLP